MKTQKINKLSYATFLTELKKNNPNYCDMDKDFYFKLWMKGKDAENIKLS